MYTCYVRGRQGHRYVYIIIFRVDFGSSLYSILRCFLFIVVGIVVNEKHSRINRLTG